jgi:integrase
MIAPVDRHARNAEDGEPKRRKKRLNDRTVKALARAAAGEGTYAVWDTLIPGFGVRVSEAGRKTFILGARFPGGSFSRHALGIQGAMSTEMARAKARQWLELIDKGTDPRADEERARIEAERKRENSFRMAAEAYVAQAVVGQNPDRPNQRKAAEVKRNIDKEFVAVWGARPVTEITTDDVENVIRAVVARAPGQARNLFGLAKRMFHWVVRQRRFGLKTSPCADLKAEDLGISWKAASDRTLNDVEIAALWRNVDRLTPTDPRNRGIGGGRVGYPYGPLYKLLLLTGLRLNECADASWGEFNFAERLWTIPAQRMKGTNKRARLHAVPLTDAMLSILEQLPRFNGGKFLFSATGGAKPVWVSDKVKKRLDARMLRSMRALARMRGEDPAEVKLEPWVNHDLRRTLRSGLSRLRVDHDVKEAILAHVKPGIVGTYDRYDLAAEKREALQRWSAMVHGIVSPPADNVVRLSGRA